MDRRDDSPLEKVTGLAYSREGVLAVASLEAIGLWDGEWRGVLPGLGATVHSVGWNGGRLVAGGADGRVWVWDAEGRRLERTMVAGDREVVAGWVPGGKRVWTYSAWPGVVKVWKDGEVAGEWRGSAVAFREDGGAWATGEGKRIVVRDGGQVVRELDGHTDVVSGLAWKGGRLASIARDGALRVCETATGKTAGVWERVTHGGAQVAWDPAGKRIAVSCLDAVHFWEAGRREPVMTLRGHRGDVRALAWNGDGSRLASGGADRTVRIWDGRTGELLETLETQPVRWGTRAVDAWRSVGEAEFLAVMSARGARQDREKTEFRRYDPVKGDLLDGYWQWRGADGGVEGKMEVYSWRGEMQFVYLVAE